MLETDQAIVFNWNENGDKMLKGTTKRGNTKEINQSFNRKDISRNKEARSKDLNYICFLLFWREREWESKAKQDATYITPDNITNMEILEGLKNINTNLTILPTKMDELYHLTQEDLGKTKASKQASNLPTSLLSDILPTRKFWKN